MEVSRRKDLGKVITNTITLKIETLWREQKKRVGYNNSGPLSPSSQHGSVGSQKKGEQATFDGQGDHHMDGDGEELE